MGSQSLKETWWGSELLISSSSRKLLLSSPGLDKYKALLEAGNMHSVD